MSISHDQSAIHLAAAGDAAKAAGIALAATRRPDLADRFEARLLAALLDSPDGTATSDDATDGIELIAHRRGGGKYVGATVSRLARQRVIAPVRAADGTRVYLPSIRPARHRTPVALWRLIDRPTAERRLAELRAALATAGDPDERTLF